MLNVILNYLPVVCFTLAMFLILLVWLYVALNSPYWIYKIGAFIGFLNQLIMIHSFIKDVLL